MRIVENMFNLLMKHYDVFSIGEVLEHIDIPKGTYDSWKNRKTIPTKRLKQISDKTGIPIYVLLGGTESTSEKKVFVDISDNERSFLKAFETLDSVDQKRIFKEVMELAEKKKSFDFTE